MWCAFEGKPLILRAYGEAKLMDESHPEWASAIGEFPSLPGSRQVITLKIEVVQSSCGMGVPLYSYQGDRDGLIKWANKKGEKGVKKYRDQKNRLSLDGKIIQSY
ncbi:MAG: pyridoxamine 5'-phosphate oxidase family protein, partial [Bacteroidota bacterium]